MVHVCTTLDLQTKGRGFDYHRGQEIFSLPCVNTFQETSVKHLSSRTQAIGSFNFVLATEDRRSFIHYNEKN